MKSFLAWGKKTVLVGSILLSSLVVNVAQALALTTEQVVERLRSVPVFTLANSEGKPLIAVPEEGEQNQLPNIFVFINQQDAQTSLNNLKERDPQTAEGIQVTPISLARVYEYEVTQRSQEQDEQVRFTFIPNQQQVEAARAVLQQNGENAQQFAGVPLFVAKQSGEEGGYLVIEQGEEQVVPMYFDRAGLQALLDRLRQVQPDLASTVRVQVVNLESVLQTFHNSDNQDLNRIVLVPSQSSIEFIRALQQNQSGGAVPQPQQQNQSGGSVPQPQQAQPNR